MTEMDKQEARMLYRRSGYRKSQIKILCELYQASRAEMLMVLQGMPSQTDEIRREILRGTTRKKTAKMYGVSESTVRRVAQKLEKERKTCHLATSAGKGGANAIADAGNIRSGRRAKPQKSKRTRNPVG